MGSFAVMPNFRNCQPNRMMVNAAQTDLPALDRLIMPGIPSKIFVQALSTNTESIFIGPTGVLADAQGAVYELAIGASLFLPSHVIANWKLICATGGQYVLVTYFSGVF
jgi:hypothetical protein